MLVRRGYAAFNRGNFEAAASVFHPEAEWIPYLGAVEGAIYRGRDALMAMWTELIENLGLRVEIKELIDADEAVVAVVEARGIGTASGVEVRRTWAQLASIRDGLVVRVEPFADKDAALEAAGIRE